MQIIRDHIILINLVFLLAIGILGGVLVRLALGPKPENSRWDAKWIFWLGVAFILSGGRWRIAISSATLFTNWKFPL